MKLNSHLHLVLRARMVELYSSIGLQGIVLNYMVKYKENLAFIFHKLLHLETREPFV
jgi:hypothetical protein